jgi:hypothetical protein
VRIVSTEGGSGAAGGRVPGLVAAAFVAHDVPDSTPAERVAAARYVDEMVAAMPDLMRVGVHVASGMAYAVLSGLGHRPFRDLDEVRRSDLVARLGDIQLPVLGEFGRLTRGLGLARVYETRHAEGDGGAE